MLKLLLGPVADLAKTYMSNKAAEKQAKHEAKMNVIQNDADWEGYAIVVDDMTVIHRVEQAFDALNGLPEWYQYLLFVAISASFGIKGASKLMGMRK